MINQKYFFQFLIFISLWSFDLSVCQQIISLDHVYLFSRYTLRPVHVFKSIQEDENITITKQAKYEFHVKRDLCWDMQYQYFIIKKKHLEDFSHKYYNEHMIMLYDDPHCGTLSFLIKKTIGESHKHMKMLLDASYDVQKLATQEDLDDMDINRYIGYRMHTYPFEKVEEVNNFYRLWQSYFMQIRNRVIERCSITLLQNVCLLLLIMHARKNIFCSVFIWVILLQLSVIDSIVITVPKAGYDLLVIPLSCFFMWTDLFNSTHYYWVTIFCSTCMTYSFLSLGLLYYRYKKLVTITNDCYVHHKNDVILRQHLEELIQEASNCLL